MPHSATDMYHYGVVFCLCGQGSLLFIWSQQVHPKYCDILADCTASIVVLTTLDIVSVCSLYVGIPETLSCISQGALTICFWTPKLLGWWNLQYYDYTLTLVQWLGLVWSDRACWTCHAVAMLQSTRTGWQTVNILCTGWQKVHGRTHRRWVCITV
jgi:hypothetical protein